MSLSRMNHRAKDRMNIPAKTSSTKMRAAIRGALTLSVLSALLLIAARPAQAQTEAVLYNFAVAPDGSNPRSSLTSYGGNFYGTTSKGGAYGYGSIFELSSNGSGGWNETVLYSFTGGTDGASPLESNLIFDSAGNMYGTASSGGANGDGVAFELSPGPNWTETVLYSFAGATAGDGAGPGTGLIMDSAGNLYGTTNSGGSGNNGTVFELSQSGGVWSEQVIYSVGISNTAMTGLTMDASGNIYGATASTIFELIPGLGSWGPSVLYTFADGSSPNGPLALDSTGSLYGTTASGNNHGSVFKLSSGKNGWTRKTLHAFMDKDGSQPAAGIVFDAKGNIYGTTQYGGAHKVGTVFELVAVNGLYKENVLLSFDGTNGANPLDNLILDSTGGLYGTTASGGSNGNGVVFEVKLPSALTPTTTTLTSVPNPSTPGQSVTFTATVTSGCTTPPCPAPPDGETVTFYKNGATVLGSGTLSGGVATFQTSFSSMGTTKATAVYGGDFNFDASTSAVYSQVVRKPGITKTTLTSSLNPSAYGQSVTFTAQVYSSVPPVGDSVTFDFYEGGNSTSVQVPLTLNSLGGIATYTTASLPAGTTTKVQAVYGGDSSLLIGGSTSNIVNQKVEKQPTTVTLTASYPDGSGPSLGQPAVFTATVSPAPPDNNDELVSFIVDGHVGTPINVQLSAGSATYTIPSLSAGKTTVRATYKGDASLSGSASSVVELQVAN